MASSLSGRMTKPALPVVAALAALVVSACSEAPEQALANRWPMLTQYCTDCHNDNDLAGGMSLQHVTTADVAANPKRWEEVVRRLRGSLMPPPGNPHPTIDQARQFVAALEVNLDAAAAQRGAAPGRTLLHRLNRVEYATAVEDLLGVSVDPAKLLPPDATSDGFDNVAEVLRVTPTYLDQYIAAAREVSIKAVGNPQAPPTRAEYVAKNQNHTTHVAGLPLGTRDGLVVEHYFPADGQYVFRLSVTSASGAFLIKSSSTSRSASTRTIDHGRAVGSNGNSAGSASHHADRSLRIIRCGARRTPASCSHDRYCVRS
mgnify:CR=1 FL=1